MGKGLQLFGSELVLCVGRRWDEICLDDYAVDVVGSGAYVVATVENGDGGTTTDQ